MCAGGDVPHTPLPLSFAILRENGAVNWFLDPRKLTRRTATHLGSRSRSKTPEILPALDRNWRKDGKTNTYRSRRNGKLIVEALREANA